ncbi:hypothetical protein PRZ48_006900 [Zasmidium cellare]|uniref:Uncharacterized protein n=1 Tax=Zasmidium cellare TaxID=395010 RepID=A0ABR0EHV0_ZASCE|nr:hypothetical protein PRZ48_006900 [Zasmidium cellare]
MGTGRADNNSPPREVSPMDPSLERNPVPMVQDLTSYSIGPGSEPDAESKFSTAQVIQEECQVPFNDMLKFVKNLDTHQATIAVPVYPEDYERTDEEEEALEEQIRDRTWGFYAFVTDYEAASQSKLPRALDNLLKCVRFGLRYDIKLGASLQVADEVWQRFRLEIVEDKRVLENASVDRVRATFVSLIRARRPDFGERDTGPPRGTRYQTCLLLDTESIESLASLEVPEQPSLESWKTLDKKMLKAVSAQWQRPQRSDSTYRGWYPATPVELENLFAEAGSDCYQLEDRFEDESSGLLADTYGYPPHLRRFMDDESIGTAKHPSEVKAPICIEQISSEYK